MSTAINRYKADLRELFFVLFEQNDFATIGNTAPYEGWDTDTSKAMITEAYRFAKDVLGPLNGSGDREGCRLENGRVLTPKGFKEAWKQLYEAGLKQLAVPKEYGGQHAPLALYAIIEEILSGANVAFNMYPGLAWGAAEVIAEFGTEAQRKLYCERMFNGVWGGTMCLTEPQAGSDVGSATTRAVKQADGRYKITGTKIFISGGDHDCAENVVHLVLARVEGAPAGTRGLSLFIVPRLAVDAQGKLGKENDVVVPSIEHKMGINGSATCVLNFGEGDACYGELVGTQENVGISQMFRMMNGARIAVGIQGLSVTSSAYLNALEYAKDRKQGAHFSKWKDAGAPRVNILQHPNVRRQLLEMKAYVEGIRALIVKLAAHRDRGMIFQGKDDEKSAYHMGQVDLLTPLVKAFSTDEAFRLCAQGIQVYGGAGFLKDWPVEQYTRDAKIFSIYEGTNDIQAMDLVGRKLGQNGGANFQAFVSDVSNFVEVNRKHPSLGAEVERLSAASESLMQVAMNMLGWSQSGRMDLIPLVAPSFLKMMSITAVGWLLIDAGIKAEAASGKASATDKNFYAGKIASAKWFGRNALTQVDGLAKSVLLEDASPVEISDDSFATE